MDAIIKDASRGDDKKFKKACEKRQEYVITIYWLSPSPLSNPKKTVNY